MPWLHSLEEVNTSNQRFRDIITGASKEKLPPTGNHLWVDVRDLAIAHVSAMEKAEAQGSRFFITAGNFSNRMIVDVIRDEFPKLKGNLPNGKAVESGDFPPDGMYYGFDNTNSREVLGMSYRSAKATVVDTVKSLQKFLP